MLYHKIRGKVFQGEFDIN